MLHSSQPSLLLYGHIVDAMGTAQKRYVWVEHGIIRYVGAEKPTHIPQETVHIQCGKDQFIYPGFINLHTHIDYNLLPMWNNTYANQWDNRFEWRGWDTYHQAISKPIQYVRDHWNDSLYAQDSSRPSLGIAFQAFSEIQAVAGGTTILQSDTKLSDESQRKHVLIRNTGTASDMGLPEGKEIQSHVDFYNPKTKPINVLPPYDTGAWRPCQKDAFIQYQQDVQNPDSKLRGMLVHLAEGRSGAGLQTKGVDGYTRSEFDAFKVIMERLDPERVRSTHFGIIHGCGIDTMNLEHLSFLKRYGMGLIWSPVSNMLLYGDTVFAYLLRELQIPLSLGSDWSPSGSKHVLEEAKYARWFSQLLQLPFSDIELYQMITKQPATLLNIPAGEIKEGYFGDFFILNRPKSSMQPLEALFSSTDQATELVIMGGKPVFGNISSFAPWNIEPQPIPLSMGRVASTKGIYNPPHLGIQLEEDFAQLTQLFKSQGVQEYSLPLVVDDPFYQEAMYALRMYTVRYAEQIRANPRSDRNPTYENAMRLAQFFSN